MNEVWPLVARGVAGGTLVVVFALISQVVSPKAFSGLFAAAPAVALASLGITVVTKDALTARQDAIGMSVGGIAMAAACVVAVAAIPRLKALWGSAVSWVAWLVMGLGVYWTVFIGGR